MCEPTTLAVTGMAMSVASAGVGYAQASSNAKSQADHQNKRVLNEQEYQAKVYADQAAYQQRVATYQQESYDEQISYRDELIQHQEDIQAVNVSRANDAAIRNYSEILTRLSQEEISGAMEIEGIRQASQTSQSIATNSMSDRGVDGNLGDYLINEIARVELADTQAINQERLWRNLAYQGNLDSVEAEARGRVEAGIPQPIAMPTLPAPQAPVQAFQPIQTQAINQPNPLSYGLQAGQGVLQSATWGRQNGAFGGTALPDAVPTQATPGFATPTTPGSPPTTFRGQTPPLNPQPQR